MADRGKIPSIAVVVGLAAGLFLVMRGRAAPSPGGGLATPGGSIKGVEVAQGASPVMGSHLISKGVGGSATVQVSWTASTKDSRGNPIAWPYLMGYRFLRASDGELGAWQLRLLGSLPNGSYSFAHQRTLASWFTPGDYHLITALYADTSSSSGTPNTDAVGEGTGVFLSTRFHPWAMRVVPTFFWAMRVV